MISRSMRRMLQPPAGTPLISNSPDTPNNPESHRKGVIALLLTAVLWSTGGVAIKLIDWHPMALSGTRSFIAFIFLFVVTRKFRLPKSRYDVAASFCFALTVISFVTANKLTTSANAIFLQYISPAFAAAFGYALLRERLERRDWVLLVGMAVGMILFFSERLGGGGFAGNIIAVLSGVFMALFIVFSRKSAENMALNNMMWGHLIAAVAAIPFYFSAGFPGRLGMAVLIYMGVVQIGTTSILFAYGIRRFPALSTSMITLLEPILNPIWVFLLVHEIPSIQAVFGGSVILAVIVARSVRMPSGRS